MAPGPRQQAVAGQVQTRVPEGTDPVSSTSLERDTSPGDLEEGPGTQDGTHFSKSQQGQQGSGPDPGPDSLDTRLGRATVTARHGYTRVPGGYHALTRTSLLNQTSTKFKG